MAAGPAGHMESSVDGWTGVETHGQVTFRPDTFSHPVGHVDMICPSMCPPVPSSMCPSDLIPVPQPGGGWRILDRLGCPAGHMDRAVDGWMFGWTDGGMDTEVAGQADTGTCPDAYTDSSMDDT